MKKKAVSTIIAGSLALAPMGFFAGCESLPGDKGTQGAVIGGVGGAVAGAALGGDNRLLGGLIGGALGAGGGYLIGSQLDKSDDEDDAIEANERAQDDPVTAAEARDARTADVNNDGYVTMDEVVALERAGLTDNQIIDRLDATDQFFELTPQQKDYLLDQGVSQRVVNAMDTINEDIKDEAYSRYNFNPTPR